MSLENHLALVQWISSHHGYLHPNVELAFDVDKGYHARVVADRAIEAGTIIAKSSMSTSLSVLNALHTPPFSCRGTRFPSTFIRNQNVMTVQCFFLMEQWVLQENSWWAPYLSTLPKPEKIGDLYFTDTDADLAGFQGTGLQALIKKQFQRWRVNYTTAINLLIKCGWPNAVENKYSWGLFCWSCVMFGSRSFTSQVLSNTLPADKARPMGQLDPDHELLSELFEDGFAVLLPLLDLLNYRPFSRIEWQAGLNQVGLQMLDQVEAGQEVCNNYGPRDNETLMLGYGFSIPANPFDQVTVGFKVPPNSPLAEVRTWLASESSGPNTRNKDEEEYRYHIYNIEHPQAKSATCLETTIFSQDLVDSISVLSANFRELQSQTFRSRGYVLGPHPKRLAGRRQHRNLLQTLGQLRLECSNRSWILGASIARLKGACPSTSTQKELYADMYRHSQLTILETAAVLCRYCLLRAQTFDLQKNDLVAAAAVAEKVPESSQAVLNVQKLVQRMAAVVRAGTLFKAWEAAQLLPERLAVKISKVTTARLESIEKYLREHPAGQLPAYIGVEEKISFMDFLVVLRETYSNRSLLLSNRLTSWMDNLQKWYPFDDEFWSGPTEEFLPILEALVGSPEDGTLDTDRLATGDPGHESQLLCWAWNVQEEEGLFSDTKAPQKEGGEVVEYQPSGYLLFIPQELETEADDQDGVHCN